PVCDILLAPVLCPGVRFASAWRVGELAARAPWSAPIPWRLRAFSQGDAKKNRKGIPAQSPVFRGTSYLGVTWARECCVTSFSAARDSPPQPVLALAHAWNHSQGTS